MIDVQNNIATYTYFEREIIKNTEISEERLKTDCDEEKPMKFKLEAWLETYVATKRGSRGPRKNIKKD